MFSETPNPFHWNTEILELWYCLVKRQALIIKIIAVSSRNLMYFCTDFEIEILEMDQKSEGPVFLLHSSKTRILLANTQFSTRQEFDLDRSVSEGHGSTIERITVIWKSSHHDALFLELLNSFKVTLMKTISKEKPYHKNHIIRKTIS